MLVAVLLVVLGIGLLVVGGETLLRGSVGLATVLSLTPAVIGLTVVAAGTSIPELAVSGVAAIQGSPDIAVANVVGSNIFNITVIIGICAIVRPFPILGNTLRLEYPALAIITVLAVVLLQDRWVGRMDAILFVGLYVAFTAYLIRVVRRQMSTREEKRMDAEVSELESKQPSKAWLSILLVVVGIVLLGLGAQATVSGASQLARLWGWSERLIGLTIVSAGTGLPEVVASLVSSIRGRSDIAIGNVIGSNIFNLLIVLGFSGLLAPLPVLPGIASGDCWWMLGTTLVLLPIILNGKKVYRWEGFALLIIYGIYMIYLNQTA